jgi:hypothetical protein
MATLPQFPPSTLRALPPVEIPINGVPPAPDAMVPPLPVLVPPVPVGNRPPVPALDPLPAGALPPPALHAVIAAIPSTEPIARRILKFMVRDRPSLSD